MRAFDRYAPFVQEYIYQNHWENLRSIQVAAADAIFNTDENVLLTASTASGKTEAAFELSTFAGAKQLVEEFTHGWEALLSFFIRRQCSCPFGNCCSLRRIRPRARFVSLAQPADRRLTCSRSVHMTEGT